MSLKKKVMMQHGLVNNLNYSNKNLHFYTKWTESSVFTGDLQPHKTVIFISFYYESKIWSVFNLSSSIKWTCFSFSKNTGFFFFNYKD